MNVRAQHLIVRIVLAALLALAGGCVDFSATRCPSGRVCPSAWQCAANQDVCIRGDCGNGTVDPGEGCDDGNIEAGDGCSDICQVEVCGNSVTEASQQQAVSEQCDCGAGDVAPPPDCQGRQNSAEGGLCNLDCRLHCGDGRLNLEEACDGTELAVSCLDLGFDRGLLSCSSTCSVITESCRRIGWEQHISGTGNVYAVWGAGAADIYAVGEPHDYLNNLPLETMRHFDGHIWSVVPGWNQTLLGIWGSGPADVFAVGPDGAIVRYDGQQWAPMDAGTELMDRTLTSVWGSGRDGDVFAAGYGVILRHDRQAGGWAAEPLPATVPSGTPFAGIWGSGPGDIYAVGNDGVIVHYDGTGWVRMDSGTEAYLAAVWGSGPGDVYAVGDRGTIVRYDGTSWARVPVPSTDGLLGIWGSGPEAIMAVGQRGTSLRWDGAVWTALDTGTNLRLEGGFAPAPGSSVAVGWNGAIMHSRTWTWARTAAPTDEHLQGVWSSAQGEVLALLSGGRMLRFDGAAWSLVPSGVTRSSRTLRAITSTGTGELIAVGDRGTVVRRGPEGTWSLDQSVPACAPPQNPTLRRRLRSVWSAPSGDEFVVGQAEGFVAIVLHRDAQGWRCEDAHTTARSLYGVWGRNEGDVFAVGGATGTDSGLIRHYDGSAWTPMEHPGPVNASLYGVWGTGDQVFAVGDMGTVLHYRDDRGWAVMATPGDANLRAVWGLSADDVYAVGFGGSIWHYDGAAWSQVRSGTEQRLTGISGVLAPSGTVVTVTITGETGTVLRLVRAVGGI